MSDLESNFLREFFGALRDRQVRYLVLRSSGQLPLSAGRGDLDVLVSPASKDDFFSVLREAVKNHQGAFVGCAESPGFCKAHFLLQSESNEWWGLCIDVFTFIPFRGRELFAWSALSPGLECIDGIFFLNSYYGNLLGLIKELLWNRRIDQRYLDKAVALAAEGWEGMEDAFPLALLGESPGSFIQSVKHGASSQSGQAVLANELVRRANQFMRKKGYWKGLGNSFRYQASKLQRMLFPSGFFVAFLGVDGAGKSTLIDLVVPILDGVTHGGVHVRHLRPGLLPPLANLLGRSSSSGGEVTNPHGSRPSGRIGSVIRTLYYAADYFLGYWLIVRTLLARKPDVVIFDRFHFDLFLDPRRFRIGLSNRMLRPLVKLLPQPELVICLVADPKAVHQRKPELPFREVCEQVSRLEMLAGSLSNAVVVKTDKSETESRNEILIAMRDKLLERKSNGCDQ